MPNLVVDASVAIKWLNPTEPLAEQAHAIRDTYAQGQVSFIVPMFWEYEIINGVNKAVARGDLTEQEGVDATTLLLTIQAEKVPLPPPLKSYELARKYQRSVYDSWYIALAEERGCEFWTSDLKLYNAVKDRLLFVRWLGDYRTARRTPQR